MIFKCARWQVANPSEQDINVVCIAIILGTRYHSDEGSLEESGTETSQSTYVRVDTLEVYQAPGYVGLLVDF